MKTYTLQGTEQTPTGCVWAFDLGKGSIGEAVRHGTTFLHKASLLIPADFAETKTAANRRRMWRTRQAHKAREKWLREVMQKAGLEVLNGRQIGKVDENGKPIPQSEWKKTKGKWVEISKADPRLEREFAENGDPTCYTSCLLRIKLLRGEKLEPWQVYKAFHSAIQKRGYGKVPWAAREQRRAGKTQEQIEKEQAKKDLAYLAALEAWPKFKQEVPDERYHFPAYYDAFKMGLWKPGPPETFQKQIDCQAKSTRNVRFDRVDVQNEIRKMVEGAARHYPSLAGKANYVLYGAPGEPYASYNPELREKFKLREGGENDWHGVLGQKIPRFDNRIVNDCALLPRLQVCAVHFRFDDKGLPRKESLLPAEFAFLWKLKNLRFSRNGGEDGLTSDELKRSFDFPDPSCYGVQAKTWPEIRQAVQVG